MLRNYFIIEKDNRSIRTIKDTLQEVGGFQFLGCTTDREAALDMLLMEQPDLVLIGMDDVIEDPFGVVLELYRHLDTLPGFIALSGTKDLAYQAIKYGFLDYILYPVSGIEVRKSVYRYYLRERERNI
ncbi:response regulator [Sinomicrobium sp. M5D2P17]